MRITEVLFALIDFELTGKALSEEVINSINSAVTEDLIKITKAHDLTHVLADVLKKIDRFPTGEQGEKLKKSKKVAIFRSETIKADTERAAEILEKAKIPFIKLKGARAREFYPEDFMRTSCDIDILVHNEDLDLAVEELEKGGWKVRGEKKTNDISLFSDRGSHLELHFSIKGGRESIDKVLSEVWDYACPIKEGGAEYIQTPEFYMFNLISHIAAHFVTSGCGIKYFIDLWILREKMEFNKDVLNDICKKADIVVFYKNIMDLIDVWFGNKEHNVISKRMETFVLLGGVYGIKSNRLKNNQVKTKSKAKNIVKRFFVPHEYLKKRYKLLENKKYLTPVFQVVRWIDLAFEGKLKSGIKEMKEISNITKKEFRETELFFKDIGLLR